MPHTENLGYQGVAGVRGGDECAVTVSEDFLEEAAFELNLKGHFQFLARRIMLALKGVDRDKQAPTRCV